MHSNGAACAYLPYVDAPVNNVATGYTTLPRSKSRAQRSVRSYCVIHHAASTFAWPSQISTTLFPPTSVRDGHQDQGLTASAIAEHAHAPRSSDCAAAAGRVADLRRGVSRALVSVEGERPPDCSRSQRVDVETDDGTGRGSPGRLSMKTRARMTRGRAVGPCCGRSCAPGSQWQSGDRSALPRGASFTCARLPGPFHFATLHPPKPSMAHHIADDAALYMPEYHSRHVAHSSRAQGP
ncbi:hypothetical protein FA95DRAFT_878731 [Auriscalpium vulgare]|uniref:Uncharacterized protein n=1 Tax=Auriscalpium vulgare TaxID=40419 RepID=A0ACB8S0A3_9AGAM|nr:hypothetical protein FA95DRAFT_878731 [Auriscalpium vulgare]